MNVVHTLLSHSPRSFVGAGVLGLASGVGSAGMLALVNTAIANPAPSTAGAGLRFLLVVLLVMATTAASQMVIVRLAQGVVLDLQRRLVGAVLQASLPALERIGTPRLLAALTADVDAVSRAAPWVAGLWVNALVLLGCLAYLAWLSPTVLAVLLGVLVLGGFTYRVLLARGLGWIRKSHESRDALYRHFRALLGGIKELKLHRPWRARFFHELFATDAERFRDARVKGTSIFAITGAFGVTLFFLAIGLLVFVLPGVTTVSDALLIKYAVTILFMITPLRGLLNAVPEVEQANVALRRVDALGLDLQEAPRALQTSVTEASAGPRFQRLSLEQVTFEFPARGDESPFALGPIDVELQAGELVFIVGGNGSGKSTLAKVLTGLYPITGGRLLRDGAVVGDDTDASAGVPNAHAVSMDEYRALFSGVFADGFVFDELLGPAVDEGGGEAVQGLLEQLELTRKVEVTGRRFSTTALSSGQRKRLGLLATCLEDRPIYLFDEWAAEQDPRFKDVFYRTLLPELARAGKTIVAITHDDRYFACADRILRMEDGQILPEDSPTVARQAT
ncbi:MAG: cyclic peptide export ABC transporter [Pseudomonadota bacterium]